MINRDIQITKRIIIKCVNGGYYHVAAAFLQDLLDGKYPEQVTKEDYDKDNLYSEVEDSKRKDFDEKNIETY